MPKQNITIKSLIAMTMADVDIFLLKEADQETDKQKNFNTKEIRNQLHTTCNKVLIILKEYGCNIDEEIKFSKLPNLN